MSKRVVYVCATCKGDVPASRWGKHIAKHAKERR